MQVGLLMVFQNFEDGVTDQAAWERDITPGGLAERLGFNTLSAVAGLRGFSELRRECRTPVPADSLT